MRRNEGIWVKLKIALFMLLVLTALCVCWTAAYYLIYLSGWHISGLVRQLANSMLGFVIFGICISIISRIGRKRQLEFFQTIIDALKRIAGGDFNVMIPVNGRDNEPFTEIIQSINNMAADLNKLESMRQEFISDVSHEIQSPLTSISGFARVLKEKQLSAMERDHYLNIIEQESVRLSRLSENMLRLASLDSEQHPFNPVSFRLDKQLQKLILVCEPQWQEKELDMTAEMDPVTVEADPDLLSQVWVNLLHNAIKFTPAGGSIQVRLTAGGQQVTIIVEDSGIGISEEDQSHIFERFYKADKSRTHSGGGSGLGLSIIQKIVEMHQGSVQVFSRLVEGTKMTVCLPLHAAKQSAAHPVQPIRRNHGRRASELTSKILTPKKRLPQ
ncbi:HAMP domain-containing sensor histidine kinase [Paenibacillus sp.]|jgi:signal transduction histidine kinase|uniref:HAMP domain-containing sensor histidine kinase n=1 Tax=Paenibacillus sp. TaxID=58172 RepID=UPI002838180A|nr:HAMP domain-containing sensor histidine kinase [Paenibacillus sp.]MDR0271654.1 HAMP domain-containing histidine kinase [Paenibacillus sp.]